MDRINISANSYDIGRASFAKPAAKSEETKSFAKAASEVVSSAVESDISATGASSAQSSIRSMDEARDMVARSASRILEKADSSVLSQANQNPKDVENLLQFAS